MTDMVKSFNKATGGVKAKAMGRAASMMANKTAVNVAAKLTALGVDMTNAA